MIKENEKNEALDNIKYVKNLIVQTKEEMGQYNSGWIAVLWGIFCVVGFMGQRLFIPHGPWEGAWWSGLALITVFITYRIVRRKIDKRTPNGIRYIMRKMFVFWIPLVVLAYTLTAFCLLHPQVSEMYIPIGIMLVISTGYLMLGFLAEKAMIFMGIAGYLGCILTAIYLLDQSDIVFSILFGGGLILTGLSMNQRQKTREKR
jgi:hypothetical protein